MKMLRTLLKVSTVFLFLLPGFKVDANTTYFAKEFGDTVLSNHGNSVIQMNSGSIFIAGYAKAGNGSNNRDFTVSKLDAYGNLLWTNSFGSIQDETSARMVFDGNKSLIICGQQYDTSTYKTVAMLLSIDTIGNLEWMRLYGTPLANQSFSGLCMANDGGLLASGFQSDSTSMGNNFLLIKTDSQGNQQWSKTFGDPGNNEVSDAVLQLPDNDILISGDRQVDPAKYNPWLIKTDSSGNFIWDLLNSNRNNGGCKNILVDDMNNILVIGESATDSGAEFDIQLTKCDINGNLIWMKYVPATNQSDAGFAIQEDGNSHYMITGYYYDTLSASKKIIMMLLDTAGNEINRSLYGNGLQNIGYDLQPSVYGGFLIAGTDFTNSQYVIIYDNVLPPDGIENMNHHDHTIYIYPNPVSEEFIAKGTTNKGLIRVFDVAGNNVLVQPAKEDETNIECKNLASGFYLLQYSENNRFINLKLLKY